MPGSEERDVHSYVSVSVSEVLVTAVPPRAITLPGLMGTQLKYVLKRGVTGINKVLMSFFSLRNKK